MCPAIASGIVTGSLSKDVFERRTSTGSGSFSSIIHEQCFSVNQNRLYESKDTWQYKFVSVKSYYKGKGLTSG